MLKDWSMVNLKLKLGVLWLILSISLCPELMGGVDSKKLNFGLI